MTFDQDVLHAGSLRYIWVKLKGQDHGQSSPSHDETTTRQMLECRPWLKSRPEFKTK